MKRSNKPILRKVPKSVVAGVANDLWKKLISRKRDDLHYSKMSGIIMKCRWCTNKANDRTGGMVITAMLPETSFESQDNIVTRLKPNFTEQQFIKRVSSVFEKASDNLNLNIKRDYLHNLVIIERINRPDKLKTIKKIEKDTGHTMIYSDMSSDDIDFWLNKLEELNCLR